MPTGKVHAERLAAEAFPTSKALILLPGGVLALTRLTMQVTEEVGGPPDEVTSRAGAGER